MSQQCCLHYYILNHWGSALVQWRSIEVKTTTAMKRNAKEVQQVQEQIERRPFWCDGSWKVGRLPCCSGGTGILGHVTDLLAQDLSLLASALGLMDSLMQSLENRVIIFSVIRRERQKLTQKQWTGSPFPCHMLEKTEKEEEYAGCFSGMLYDHARKTHNQELQSLIREAHCSQVFPLIFFIFISPRPILVSLHRNRSSNTALLSGFGCAHACSHYCEEEALSLKISLASICHLNHRCPFLTPILKVATQPHWRVLKLQFNARVYTAQLGTNCH